MWIFYPVAVSFFSETSSSWVNEGQVLSPAEARNLRKKGVNPLLSWHARRALLDYYYYCVNRENDIVFSKFVLRGFRKPPCVAPHKKVWVRFVWSFVLPLSGPIRKKRVPTLNKRPFRQAVCGHRCAFPLSPLGACLQFIAHRARHSHVHARQFSSKNVCKLTAPLAHFPLESQIRSCTKSSLRARRTP